MKNILLITVFLSLPFQFTNAVEIDEGSCRIPLAAGNGSNGKNAKCGWGGGICGKNATSGRHGVNGFAGGSTTIKITGGKNAGIINLKSSCPGGTGGTGGKGGRAITCGMINCSNGGNGGHGGHGGHGGTIHIQSDTNISARSIHFNGCPVRGGRGGSRGRGGAHATAGLGADTKNGRKGSSGSQGSTGQVFLTINGQTSNITVLFCP